MIPTKRTKSTPMSDYKKDIVDLIGIDFEATPVEGLRFILHKSADFLPKLLDKNFKMSQEEVCELLQIELGVRDKGREEADKALERIDQLKTCETLRENYWKRRNGKIACDFRCSIGSSMTKKLALPILTQEAEEELINSMRNYFPFKHLDDEGMKLMVVAMSKLIVDAGEFLIKKGDFTEKFYYVQNGLFGQVVAKSDKCYVTEYLKPGQCFGSEYLLFGNYSSKTIKCLTTATVWILESMTYHSVCHWGLLETNQFLEKSISMTPGLDEANGERLVNALVPKMIGNKVDVLAVTPRSALYIVYKGEVLVKEVNVRGDVFTRICGPGDKFGQDRLFTKRFAQLDSAKTLSKVILYYLNEDAFNRLFDVLELYKMSDVEAYQDDLFFRTL